MMTRQRLTATDARSIRERVLDASFASGHGHIPTCFSVIEMMCAVYNCMRYDPQSPDAPERDLFVLSKGHAALGYYAVLSACGFFPGQDLDTFGLYKSQFGCHADRTKIPGVEVSTGSLGHGICVAVGMALAEKIDRSDRQVYTLIGDGESNEGTIWEALMVAADQSLSNFTVLYDNNQSQGRALQILNPAERFAAFGCEVFEVDGHDIDALEVALLTPVQRPRAIVANTTKGKGCRTLEDNVYEWHRRAPDEALLASLKEELYAASV